MTFPVIVQDKADYGPVTWRCIVSRSAILHAYSNIRRVVTLIFNGFQSNLGSATDAELVCKCKSQLNRMRALSGKTQSLLEEFLNNRKAPAKESFRDRDPFVELGRYFLTWHQSKSFFTLDFRFGKLPVDERLMSKKIGGVIALVSQPEALPESHQVLLRLG